MSVDVYVGWDKRDVLAFEVCATSLLRHASGPVNIIPVKEWELRYTGAYSRPYRVDHDGQMWDDQDHKPFSTDFSFTRFAVPHMMGFADEWAVFCDADVLWTGDVYELMRCAESDKAIMCVKHDHAPVEERKMGGLIQTVYRRKNWSSVMLVHGERNKELTPAVINSVSGSLLHGMAWLRDDAIGSLDETWNWLDGHSTPRLDGPPKLIHFTRGTPDMPGCRDYEYADLWREELAHVPPQFGQRQHQRSDNDGSTCR